MFKKLKFLLGFTKQPIVNAWPYILLNKDKIYIGGSVHKGKPTFQGKSVRFRQRLVAKTDYCVSHVFIIVYDKFIGRWLVLESAGQGTHGILLKKFLKTHEITFLSEQKGVVNQLLSDFFDYYSGRAYGYFSGIANIAFDTLAIPFRFKKTGAYICSELVLELNLHFGGDAKYDLIKNYVGDRDHDLITPLDIIEIEKILTEQSLSKIILSNEQTR
ncbi:MAG: hypothetical protein HAW60_06195 [Bdellovibrionales bacterium]|nr:hypothetical protein [Bdellovibrionales bacterium]